jgi:DNA polymerase-3 subunit gamma/tau
MSYEVTATRKRPKNFDELTGQEFVVSSLKNSIASERIAHAFLFSGPRGVGKTSAARILAKSLNCEKGPTPEPCGTCINCLEISAGNAMDVIEIDGASNTSVNDVREIKDEVLFSPTNGRYKIYIIDEVHMLSNSAFNALLKTIEEPPHYIVFIFATTEINKVPATIRSRCQQFNFRLIPLPKITVLLKEAATELNVDSDEDALFWIAKESTGSLRDAYTLLDQVISFSEGHVTLEKILDKLGLVSFDRLNSLSRLILKEETSDVYRLIDEILEAGVSIEQLVVDITEYFRSILFLKHGVKKESILGYPISQFPDDLIQGFTVFHLEKIEEVFFDLFRNLRYSINPRYELEISLGKAVALKNYINPADIVKQLKEFKLSLLNNMDQNDSADKSTPQPEPLDNDLQKRIIGEVRKEKPALSSILETALEWTVLNDNIYLLFENKFRAHTVEQEMNFLREIIEKIMKKKLKINVMVDANDAVNQNDPAVSKQVEMVKKVFRGEEV